MRKKTNPKPSKKLKKLVIIAACVFPLYLGYLYYQYTLRCQDPPKIEQVCKKTDISLKQFHNKICITASLLTRVPHPTVPYHKLFSMNISNDFFTEIYSSSDFETVSGSYSQTQFCVYHQFPQYFNLSLSCNGENIYNDTIHIIEADLSNEGSSNVRLNDGTMLVLSDFCLDKNDNILFVSKHHIDAKPISLSHNKNVTLNIRPRKSVKNWNLDKWTTVFSHFPKTECWMSIMSSLLPLWKGSIEDNHGIKLRKFGMTKDEAEIYMRMSPDFRNSNAKQCFGYGVFPKSQNLLDLNYFHLIYDATLSYDSNTVKRFRENITKTTRHRDRILIDKYFAKDNQDIVNLPDFDVIILNESLPLYKIADLMHSSSIYIFSHLTTAVYGLFLDPSSMMIERKMIGAGCLDYGKRISNLVGSKYMEVGKTDEECTIPSLEKYIVQEPKFSNKNCLKEIKEKIGL
ncbi:hypothetical protein TVAG_270730 [Trichomonas vaginalis G3]|uniref:Uncharacterized protein n=1 Tax=Trichomonas vaginalis (strain ATCC PRA-98 / G3) TaxID=412133 RepID=A2FIG5_TRIV3|nr:hypothetical protein TVAGG3_0014720 [Trichomonas vaginalis G3]EAX95282.1 hypothetical protein TVAG_270730 [Trichomonas vaginalis G3]KAI5539339.1 hypothetical protein TVAGG3_0014720 [Trichomonas vaginalis G3]|eukprot:XP_001308212.1 hypothetical protein [Trichomonas vaginalis G3]